MPACGRHSACLRDIGNGRVSGGAWVKELNMSLVKELRAVFDVIQGVESAAYGIDAFLMSRRFVPDVPKEAFLMSRRSVPDVPKGVPDVPKDWVQAWG